VLRARYFISYIGIIGMGANPFQYSLNSSPISSRNIWRNLSELARFSTSSLSRLALSLLSLRDSLCSTKCLATYSQGH
jgi:hypothetical protein